MCILWKQCFLYGAALQRQHGLHGTWLSRFLKIVSVPLLFLWFTFFYGKKKIHKACRVCREVCKVLSHLLGFWQWYLLSEEWRLACHMLSQNTQGSRPNHSAFVFFYGIRLPIFHFIWKCEALHRCLFGHMHAICGLLAS